MGEQLSDLAVAEVVQKKLLVELEQAAEVRRVAAALAARQTPDFEAWESLSLQAARQGGAGVLGTLLSHGQQHAPREVILCPCGQRMSSRGRRGKGLLTTLGRVPFARPFINANPVPRGAFPTTSVWTSSQQPIRPACADLWRVRVAHPSLSRPPQIGAATRG